MEGLIRKVVWLFRERPRTAAAVTALALTILLGGSVLLIRSRQRSEAAKLIGNRLSGMELRKALLTAYKRASARGALSPLVGQELLVLQDKGIPVRTFAIVARRAQRNGFAANAKQTDRLQRFVNVYLITLMFSGWSALARRAAAVLVTPLTGLLPVAVAVSCDRHE